MEKKLLSTIKLDLSLKGIKGSRVTLSGQDSLCGIRGDFQFVSRSHFSFRFFQQRGIFRPFFKNTVVFL
jgi:hypothetical protein